jgi:phosphatidylglycerophosphate synthase
MLDGWARRRLDPLLDAMAGGLAKAGITANTVTIASALVGLASAAAVAAGAFWLALFLLLLSRLGDGLDGAIARRSEPTDLGGYLDIVLDFLFYGAFPLAFVLLDPAANAVAGAVLLLSFYVNGASFLAYAILAEKRKLTTDLRGRKSLFFTAGLAEATETIGVFVAFCLFPQWFAALAYIFAALTFYTAASRIALAARTFRQ